MAIPESQLDVWAKQGSVTQSAQTYETIKSALNKSTTSYYTKDFSIYLQGSYGNDTNVYADSDVDLVLCLNSIFYQDLLHLSESETANYKRAYDNATYTLFDFKADVIACLRSEYGDLVKPGKKAIDVKGSGNRRDADVLVCAKFRRYYKFNNIYDQGYREGICFFLEDGSRIENFPRQHSNNCTDKHQSSNSWFKPTVRIFKNMRNHMTKNGLFQYGKAPSYFLEGALWNIPTSKFGSSYQNTVVNCLNWLVNDADKPNLACANDLHYLLRNGSRVAWNEADYDAFLSAAVKLWNNW